MHNGGYHNAAWANHNLGNHNQETHNGLSVRGGGGGTPGYTFVNSEAETVVNAFSVAPDDARKELIDDLVGALKTAGVWTKLDVLYLVAAHDAQAARVNWKSPGTYDLTAVNSPTFTTDRGYAGDGTTSYLTTGFDPSGGGFNYTQNSVSIGAWARSGADTGSLGATLIGATTAFLIPRSTSDTLRGRTNQGSSSNCSDTSITTRFGLSVLNRSASNLTTGYRNGVAKGTYATASTALSAAAFFVGAMNNAGTPASFVDNQISAAFLGGSLDGTEQTDTYNALATYMTAVGA